MERNKPNDEGGGGFPNPNEEDRTILASFSDDAIVLGFKLAYADTTGSNEEVEKAIALFAWELIRRVRLRPEAAKGATDATPTR